LDIAVLKETLLSFVKQTNDKQLAGTIMLCCTWRLSET